MNETADETIRILIVDDERNVRETLADWLRKQPGYKYVVETADSGEAAIERITSVGGGFDACIMDQELEFDGMNGIEAMKAIKAKYPAIQVVIITAYVDVTKGVDALKAGAYRYIRKPYDPTEIALMLESIAELRRLEQQLQELNWLETIQAISSAFQGVFELNEVLDRIQARLRQVIRAPHCYIALRDEQQDQLDFRVFVEHGQLQEPFVRRMDAGGLSEWVMNARKSLFVEDWEKQEEEAPVPGVIVGDPHLRSFLISPLIARGNVLGVMSVQSPEPGFFAEADKSVFSAVANQAAIAIENARLHEERERRLKELRELFNLATCLFWRNLEAKQIFEQTVESLLEISAAHGANMLLFNEIGELEEPKVTAGKLSAKFKREIYARPDGMSAAVLKKGTPCTVSSPNEPPGLHPLLLEEGIKASIGLPLKTTDHVIGVLFVHYEHPHAFSEDEVNLLSLFASTAAIAIENTRRQGELAAVQGVAWMGMVASNWAHRITQKSAAIRVTVDTLRHAAQGAIAVDSKFAERLDRIERCATEIQQTPTGALLPYEDVEEPISINDLLQGKAPLWQAGSRDVQFSWKLDQADTTVRADKRWLEVALETLVSNALRAMSETPQKVLTISSQVRQKLVFVEVADTGPGIPDQVAVQLFKGPVEHPEGSGVGLLLAQTIIHRYGGNLRLLRTGPEGTAFLLWLPRARAQRTQDEDDPSASIC